MPPSKFKAYAVAFLLVLVAVGLEVAVRPFFHGRAPLVLFIIAVVISAAYGGLGPGLLATALGVGCVEFLFANSIVSLLTDQPSVWLFCVLATGLSIVIDNFQRRNAELARAKELLETANRELAQRSDDLVQSNEELTRFAYALSHDLQSPLRNVSVLTELLSDKLAGKVEDEDQQSLQFIRQGVRHANDMIRRLLAYSVADQKTRLAATTDLNSVLAAALEDAAPALKESGARVSHDPLPTVQADADRLRQVFLNLLSNAVKYRSPDRPLEIRIACSSVNEDWIVSVRDNGIGIDKEYTERIFGLFERVPASAAAQEGSGIGLAICRAIIQRHRGRMWVETELGSGSTFFFSLPLKHSA